MNQIHSFSDLSPRSMQSRFPAWRKIGFLTTALAVALTGWLTAQDDTNGVPALPVPVADVAVPNAVPEVVGTGPGEVLTRGPIHEAFAKPVVENTAEPPIVPKSPPALIEELPPDERPVGENVLWIPGYFAWDEDRLDFIWISGVYRDAPPNHAWIAGYWRSAPGGSQWVPGFWVTTEQAVANQQVETEVEFLPEPPVTLEQGPSVEQPSENHFWIPGNWRYIDNKYAWQAGYWTAAQPGWIWVPANYTWTPQGYVYIQGYWDYSLAQRGLVFAPVYFDAAYYANPRVYRPEVVLRSNFLTVHLWSRPSYSHYYFGDYYGNNYATVGYRPWFTPLVANRNYYDPLFTYYSWQGQRVNPHWNNHIQQRYEYVVNHADARPPRTYREQYRLAQQPRYQQYINNVNVVNSSNTYFDITNTTINNNQRRQRAEAFGTADDIASLQIQNVALTANLAQVAEQQRELPQAALQLQKVDPATRTRFANQGKQFREIAAQRQQMAGPRVAGERVRADTPSTSGSPATKTIGGSADRTKAGGGRVRLPVVQPVADVVANGRRAPGASLPGANTETDATVPGTNGNVAGQPDTKAGLPGLDNAAGTPAGKAGQGNAADGKDLPTDRNPNKLGKNVPPGPAPAGIGSGVVGGGFGGGAAPLDIMSGGSTVNPGINNPGNVTDQNGPNANGDGTNPLDPTTPTAPSNNPNTTANTVPGQRMPANGAFGQDRAPLVPPGLLAPGQQNPGSNATGTDNTTPTAPSNNPNTTANTVPGQRMPANGAFGQDRGPLVPPGQLAPGQQNPGSNATGTDNTTPTAPSNNPNTTANTVPGQRMPANGAFGQDRGPLVPPGQLAPGQQNPGSNATGTDNTTPTAPSNNPNTTANTVPGQRMPANGAFGQDRGPLVPPGQLAPGQRNPEVRNPRVTDPTKSTNPTGAVNKGSKNIAPQNPLGPTSNTRPDPRITPNNAFGKDRKQLSPMGQPGSSQQDPRTLNPRTANPINTGAEIPNPNPRIPTPTPRLSPAPTPNPIVAPQAANPGTRPNPMNNRPARGNSGIQNPAERSNPATVPVVTPRVTPTPGNPTPRPSAVQNPNPGKRGGNPGIQANKQRGPANPAATPTAPGRGRNSKGDEKDRKSDKE